MKFKVTVVFTLYIALTVAIAWLLLNQMRWSKQNFAKQIFKEQVNSFVFSLNERYNRNRVAFLGLEGFINASDYVTYQEWNKNITNLHLSQNFPAISWIAYVRRLPEADLEIFIEKIRAQKIDYKIWPHTYDAYSFPVVYISPSSFSSLMGYNFSTNPSTQNALEQSISSRKLVEASSLTTKFGKLKKSERVFFLPIVNPDTEQVTGWIAANLNFSTIIQQTINGLNFKSVKLRVYAGDTKNINQLIYQFNQDPDVDSNYALKKTIEFGSTTWTFAFSTTLPTQNLITVSAFFLVLLLLLVALSVGLFLYFHYLKKSGAALFDDLPEKKILAGTQYAFIATDNKGLITYFNPSAEKLLGYKAEEMIGKQTPASFHDPKEMKDRAEELSEIMGRAINPEFEVFVALAEKNTPENRRWIYIRKDQSRVNVQLSVTALKNGAGEIDGYLGVAIEASQITL